MSSTAWADTEPVSSRAPCGNWPRCSAEMAIWGRGRWRVGQHVEQQCRYEKVFGGVREWNGQDTQCLSSRTG